MHYPKISVVTPNFNQVVFLERTIRSVIDQGYPNLEYIIIDGGSTDGSIEIIKKYEDKLHYWVSESDSGMYEAIQKGFKLSSGEIMTYINSDDLLGVHSLHTAASIFMKYSHIHWINGIPNIIDEFNRIVLVGTLPNWTKFHFLTGNYKYIQQEGIFWTRSLWNRSGGSLSTNLKLAGDMELWSRFFQNEKLYYLPVILGSFRRRRSGQKSLEQLDQYHLEADNIIMDLKPANKYEMNIVSKYNNMIWKVLKKINRKKVYHLFGYKDLYDIFIHHEIEFQFDRFTQELNLKELLCL